MVVETRTYNGTCPWCKTRITIETDWESDDIKMRPPSQFDGSCPRCSTGTRLEADE